MLNHALQAAVLQVSSQSLHGCFVGQSNMTCDHQCRHVPVRLLTSFRNVISVIIWDASCPMCTQSLITSERGWAACLAQGVGLKLSKELPRLPRNARYVHHENMCVPRAAPIEMSQALHRPALECAHCAESGVSCVLPDVASIRAEWLAPVKWWWSPYAQVLRLGHHRVASSGGAGRA